MFHENIRKDSYSINKLLRKYEYLIKIIICKYNIHSKDYDDVLQEGRLGLLKAINAFELNKGANFNSFASLCINRQILSFLRNQGRKKNKILTHSYSLDYKIEIEKNKRKYYKSDLEDFILLKLQYEQIRSKSISNINEVELGVFDRYITGYSIQELSEQYDIPKKKVYVIVAKVKKRIEESLNQY